MRKHLSFAALIIIFCLQANSQTIRVQGTVVNEEGKPVPGVTITNKKTSKITGITNQYGAFSLSLSDVDSLIFSSIDYEKKVVQATTAMHVVMVAGIRSCAGTAAISSRGGAVLPFAGACFGPFRA